MATVKPHKLDRLWSALGYFVQKVVSQLVWVLTYREQGRSAGPQTTRVTS
jgi:hypothetical protein